MTEAVEKEAEETFDKPTLIEVERIYKKYKDELEEEHEGEYAVIDVDKEEVTIISSTALEATKAARRLKDRKKHVIRRIGRPDRV